MGDIKGLILKGDVNVNLEAVASEFFFGINSLEFFEANKEALGLAGIKFYCFPGFGGFPHMSLRHEDGAWVVTGYNCICATEEFLRDEFARIKDWILKFESEGVYEEAEGIVFESYIERLKEAGLW